MHYFLHIFSGGENSLSRGLRRASSLWEGASGETGDVPATAEAFTRRGKVARSAG